MNNMIDRIDKALDRLFFRDSTFAPTGISDIDKALGGGIHAGDLCVIAGRPSMGKRELSFSVIANLLRSRRGVCVLSGNPEELIGRFVCFLSGVCLKNQYDEDESETIRRKGDWLKGQTFTTLDMPIELDELINELSENRHDVVIIDDLDGLTHYLLGERGVLSEGKAYVLRDLKRLAQEMKISIIALSSVSRKCDKRKDKHPRLSDLGVNEVESIADVIILLFRESYYSNQGKKGLEVTISRNNRGPVGTIEIIECQ